MDKFTKEVVLTFFILLALSFVLGAYYVIYTGSADAWKDITIYRLLFGFSKMMLIVLDLPVFLYILVIPPFVSAKLPTLAAIVVFFFIMLNITYLYFVSMLIATFVYKNITRRR